jgi:hypothetical protein
VIHREQVAVTLADLAFAETIDGVRKIEINAEAGLADAATSSQPQPAHETLGGRGC